MEPLTEAPLGSRHRLLDDIVREEILKRILTGDLAPGERLVETSLADALGVSRGPVRAAIRQLELEGFVVISPRRGASVAAVSAAEALECYEVRAVLEGLSASLAALRRSDADIERLREILADGDQMLAQDRWDQLSQLNNRFHVALAEAGGNNQLVQLMQQYAKRIAWIFSRSAEQRGAEAWREHAGIVEAVVQRDATLASNRAQGHISASRERFVLTTPVAPDPTIPKPLPAAAEVETLSAS
ncbi:MAG TPA: GntR family transcriptional regulator [Mycobacteriales bacterium]|nr:GntR family transcriptional regulator [Mycobacteriales bacterium]